MLAGKPVFLKLQKLLLFLSDHGEYTSIVPQHLFLLKDQSDVHKFLRRIKS